MFEWDDEKNRINVEKHGVSFETATDVFSDPDRRIVLDVAHSQEEERFLCIGLAADGILTVRFVIRGSRIRIFGAGYWRKGKFCYEKRD